jgi:hypothetical protein
MSVHLRLQLDNQWSRDRRRLSDIDKTWSLTRLTQSIALRIALDNESNEHSVVSDQFTQELSPDKPQHASEEALSKVRQALI